MMFKSAAWRFASLDRGEPPCYTQAQGNESLPRRGAYRAKPLIQLTASAKNVRGKPPAFFAGGRSVQEIMLLSLSLIIFVGFLLCGAMERLRLPALLGMMVCNGILPAQGYRAGGHRRAALVHGYAGGPCDSRRGRAGHPVYRASWGSLHGRAVSQVVAEKQRLTKWWIFSIMVPRGSYKGGTPVYRLLLVDDESDIREGLQEVVDFAAHGFEVVGEATNGLEALQACERLEPDLVVTDIRMPLMDGLTMCRRVQKALPTTRFVILSGYDDFEYARQAISMNCLGYLLKPISSSEFRDMLSQAKEKLDEEFAQRRDMTRLREHFRTSLPYLREMLLSSLLSGAIGAEEARKTAARYEMPLEARQYVLALIRPQEAWERQGAIEEPELLSFAILNIAQEMLQNHTVTHAFHYNGELAALMLLDSGEESAYAACVGWLEEMRQAVDHYLDTRVLVGVSAPAQRLEHLHTGAVQALSALEQCAILENGSLVCVTDVEPGSRGSLAASDLELRSLGNALKLGDMAAVGRVLEEMLAECRESKPTPGMYRAYLLEIYMTLLRTARDVSLETDLAESLEPLMNCPPPEQAFRFLAELSERFSRQVTERRASSSRLLARQAEEYLAGHYQDPELTVEKLCGQLHISPSYFSVLFKKETKKTLVQYLTELRMDKAMSLVTGTEMKTVQIAREVGIPDPSYFSYSFKKYFGISPSQARKREGVSP